MLQSTFTFYHETISWVYLQGNGLCFVCAHFTYECYHYGFYFPASEFKLCLSWKPTKTQKPGVIQIEMPMCMNVIFTGKYKH